MMQEAQQLIAVSEQHRLGPFRLFGSAFLGWALCLHGDLDNGAAMLTKAIDKLEGIEFRLSLPGHLANPADAQRLLVGLKRKKEDLRARPDDDIREHRSAGSRRKSDALMLSSRLRHEGRECGKTWKKNFAKFDRMCAQIGISDI